jgi:hypothetical protein
MTDEAYVDSADGSGELVTPDAELQAEALDLVTGGDAGGVINFTINRPKSNLGGAVEAPPF